MRNLQDLLFRGLGDDDGKFIPTQTGHCIGGPDGRPETLGNLDQHGVTDIMAQSVIYGLERIQVQHQHGRGFPAVRTGQDCLLDPLVEQGPIRKAC